MSIPAGPFGYVRDPSLLAAALGTDLRALDLARVMIESQRAYSYRVKRVHGKMRRLAIANPFVSNIQKRIAEFLWPLSLELHPSCHGYVPGRSAISNAAVHIGRKWVQRLDIQDFYPSTRTSMVTRALELWGAAPEVASRLAQLTSDNGYLPLGPSTSPILSNLILHPIDVGLHASALQRGLSYSRYADDLTFSGVASFDMSEVVAGAIAPLGYSLNYEKTRTRKRGQRVLVTGLTVVEADRPRLPKQYKRRLRQELFYIEEFGLEDHCARRYHWHWIDDDDEDRHLAHSRRHLYGRIRYAFGVEQAWTRKLLSSFPDAASQILPAMPTNKHRVDALITLATEIRQLSEPRLSNVPMALGSPTDA